MALELPQLKAIVGSVERPGLGLNGHSRLIGSAAGSLPKHATLPSTRWA